MKTELARVQDVGGVIAECCYVVHWNKSLTFVQFLLYRPAEEWKWMGMDWNGDCNRQFAKVAAEAVPHASVQIARPTEASKTEKR